MPSFFFNDTPATEIYTLSLHDALPICGCGRSPRDRAGPWLHDAALVCSGADRLNLSAARKGGLTERIRAGRTERRSSAPMAIFPANPSRLDAYKNFKFRVKWDGKYVAGISKVSPLRRSTEVIRFREGGDPS